MKKVVILIMVVVTIICGTMIANAETSSHVYCCLQDWCRANGYDPEKLGEQDPTTYYTIGIASYKEMEDIGYTGDFELDRFIEWYEAELKDETGMQLDVKLAKIGVDEEGRDVFKLEVTVSEEELKGLGFNESQRRATLFCEFYSDDDK